MLITIIRTIVIYGLLVLAIRLMGKRQLGQLDPEEFVVTMLIANLASIPMGDSSIPVLWGIVPIFGVIAMELVLSGLAWQSIPLRRWIHGKPVILVENGKLQTQALRRTRITMAALCRELRGSQVLDIQSVQYAILETNGSISVFQFPKYTPASAKDAGIQASKQALPVTIISEGQLLEANLRLSGKSEAWLQKTLAEYASTVKDTWYLAVDQSNRVVFLPREEKP